MFSELDDGAFIERHKISALASALPEDFIRKYFSAIDTESLAAYEQALESIPRWKDAHYDMYPRKESVLDHVIEMLKMVIRIEKTCPELSQILFVGTCRSVRLSI